MYAEISERIGLVEKNTSLKPGFHVVVVSIKRLSTNGGSINAIERGNQSLINNQAR